MENKDTKSRFHASVPEIVVNVDSYSCVGLSESYSCTEIS